MESATFSNDRETQGDNSPDTVTLAKKEREKQGMWESEVSYGGEADLHRHLIYCDKNPGHKKFVPADMFNVKHLPSGCHSNDLVALVRAMLDLTVRVAVTYVSERRPKNVPGTDKPYPFYSNRGGDMMRVGTGWISDVRKFPDINDRNKTCECKECLDSPTQRRRFAQIYINTAAHVVYDELEGKHTTCHLFFDRGDSPEDCSGVVKLSCMSSVWKKTEKDFSQMRFDTHDLDLVDRLYEKMASWRSIYENIGNTYYLLRLTGSDTEKVADPNKILSIIVSHPHGSSKQVSVGHCTNTDRHIDPEKLTYTTPTCPGSSGAPVFVLGLKSSSGYLLNHHSGNCEWNRELNFCGQSSLRFFLRLENIER